MQNISIELTQLRCFLAVAEELHFGKAANRLNMTQPPLSRQIQILERQLGVKLFERSSRRVRLTLAGRRLLPEARRIVRLVEFAAISAQKAELGDEGTISVGFTAASGYRIVPKLLRAMMQDMPKVDFALHELVTRDQLDGLLAGELDVAILRPPFDAAQFHYHPLAKEPLLVALPDSAGYPASEACDLQSLAPLPLIMPSPVEARYFYDLIARHFQSVNCTPNVVQYVSQIHSMLGLVGAGIGYALVPESARYLHLEGVRFEQLVAAEPIETELFFVWLKTNDNPVLTRLSVALPKILSKLEVSSSAPV